MAYQNVSSCRFYLNLFEWLDAVGYLSNELDSMLRTLPVVPKIYDGAYIMNVHTIPDMLTGQAFVALLGHNLGTKNSSYAINNGISSTWPGNGPIINSHPEQTGLDGFSISFFYGQGITQPVLQLGIGVFDYDESIGSIIVGNYYDMDAPNLSLKIGYQYGGTKEITTYNGSSVSNTMWSKPPAWGNYSIGGIPYRLGPWELHHKNYLDQGQRSLARSGRRTWDLKFSYMDDADLWGSNQMVGQFIATGAGYDSSHFTGDPGAEMVDNGGFDISGLWIGSTTVGSFNILDSVLRALNVGSDSQFYQDITFVVGLHYKVEYEISSYDRGGIYIEYGGITSPIVSSAGTFTHTGIATVASSLCNIRTTPADSGDGLIQFDMEYISIKLITPTSFNDNILTENSFFSRVWVRTLGGILPFIFQPSTTYSNPDGFAICRFVNNSLKAKQTALNVYDISLKIEEVW
tara:strand:+ start:5276 stop:6658 length:1383 start_codon:yes stop_codon:yes gene_type:complete